MLNQNRQRVSSLDGYEDDHQGGIDLQDGASFNDNTLVTDQDEFNFGSPQGMPMHIHGGGGRDTWNSNSHSMDGLALDEQILFDSQGNVDRRRSGGGGGGGGGGVSQQQQVLQQQQQQQQQRWSLDDTRGAGGGGQIVMMEPNEHLALLATQTLATVREMVIGRYRLGKSLMEIYQHFDRKGKSYFDAQDFMRATSDLRIETTERVASIAILQIALDGVDKVSFGEFKLFIVDSDHEQLEKKVQQQLAHQLEQQGRSFQSRLYQIFWEEDEAKAGKKTLAAQSGMVGTPAFVASLSSLGLRLSASETERLVFRFDVHGKGACSVTRFLRMAQSSYAWRLAEKSLAIQEEAQEEAANVKRQLRETGECAVPGATEELVAMAEYLGIRVISEQHLLWIAADALRAPLPVSWSAQKDSRGRTFFYNHISNQSRWDHPLDPHFRNLRDKYRQSEGGEGGGDGEGDGEQQEYRFFKPKPSLPTNTHISFGGVGATLNPPPLNIQLSTGVGPRPSSAGAMMGYNLTQQQLRTQQNQHQQQHQQQRRQNDTSAGTRLPPASFSSSSSSSQQQQQQQQQQQHSRPRPQSALPERATAFPAAEKPVWREQAAAPPLHFQYRYDQPPPQMQQPQILNQQLLQARQMEDNRPLSAPHYGTAPKNNTRNNNNNVGMGAHVEEKKYSTEGIYRAPYFNLAHFHHQGEENGTRRSSGGGGVGVGGYKRVSSTQQQQSRDGGGSSMSNVKKPSAPRAQSAVDRALNKEVPSYLLPREKSSRTQQQQQQQYQHNHETKPETNSKLAVMYDDALLGRLDMLVNGGSGGGSSSSGGGGGDSAPSPVILEQQRGGAGAGGGKSTSTASSAFVKQK